MKQSMLKHNTGTNLMVRMTQTLINDGWIFLTEGDRVVTARNDSTKERAHFSDAGDLKKWIEKKSEEY